jgi:hypothetical protein
MRRRLTGCLLALAFAWVECIARGDTVGADLGRVEAFAELSAELYYESQGYFFSVSPDERWIVVVVRAPQEAVWVVHEPTRKKWIYETRIRRDPRGVQLVPHVGGLGHWYPNCFSEDSSRLYLGDFSASLSPEMASLSFERDPARKDLEALQGYFLGFRGEIRNRSGTLVSSWRAWSPRDRLTITWGPSGSVLYEVVGWPEQGNRIRVTPPGVTRLIDFGPLVETQERIFRQESEARLNADPTSERRRIEEYVREKRASFVEDQLKRTQVKELVVSPNGRWLAANASLQGGAVGDGVLIALDEDPFRARLYSPHLDGVLGKPIWSADSQRLYFLGRTHEDIGPAEQKNVETVYRLHLRE